MIKVENLEKHFGGNTALNKVDLEVESGSVTGLIGPNGAGKTVLFNIVTGLYSSDGGHVYFRDEKITDAPTWKRAQMGLARGFQQLRLFPEHTVRENLVMAARPKSLIANFRSAMGGRSYEELGEQADEILEEISLVELADTPAGEISFGQRKLVQFGILLMTDPDTIMLDEIMAGVNPNLTDRMKEYIREYNAEGRTFFIVEHDVPSIMELCDNVIVLNSGEVIARGPPESIQENERVIEAYLG